MHKLLDIKAAIHVHSTFSLIDATDSPTDLLKYCKERGIESLSITDHGHVSGLPILLREADKYGVRPLAGCEFYLDLGSDFKQYSHITVMAMNNDGYKNLLNLYHKSWDHVVTKWGKRKPKISWELLEENNQNLIAGTGCIIGAAGRMLMDNNEPQAIKNLDRLIGIFGKDRLFAEFIPHAVTHDYDHKKGEFVPNECKPLFPEGDICKGYNQWLWTHAVEQRGLKPVVSLDAHFTTPDKKVIQDALLMNGEKGWHFYNSYHFLQPQEIFDHLTYLPGFNEKVYESMITNGQEFASMINYEKQEKVLHLPFKTASLKESYALFGEKILEERINQICEGCCK